MEFPWSLAFELSLSTDMLLLLLQGNPTETSVPWRRGAGRIVTAGLLLLTLVALASSLLAVTLLCKFSCGSKAHVGQLPYRPAGSTGGRGTPTFQQNVDCVSSLSLQINLLLQGVRMELKDLALLV